MLLEKPLNTIDLNEVTNMREIRKLKQTFQYTH